jgi:hypothetical protein
VHLYGNGKGKGKVHTYTGTEALYRPYGLYGSRGIDLTFVTTALEWDEGSASRPGRSLPLKKNPVPIVQEAGIYISLS